MNVTSISNLLHYQHKHCQCRCAIQNYSYNNVLVERMF